MADLVLADRVFAPHYAKAIALDVVADVAIRVKPQSGAESDARLVAGDLFHVLDISNGWAWGHGERPGTVGYVEFNALAAL